jgi:xylulose-5-phosphate/fructose-6-phosphate phosphoketolase
MYVVNDLDRFDELGDVMNRLPRLGARAAYFKQAIGHNQIEHKEYIALRGVDIPEIAGWTWEQAAAA